MMGIDRLGGVSPLAPSGLDAAGGARGAALSTLGEIGHRVLAWVDAASHGTSSGAQAWTQTAGEAGAFRPDMGELARQGDVYGLDGLSRDLAGRFGATPAQEGTLRRALDDFTREAVVQFAGLAGAPGDMQVAGVRQALEQAGQADASEGFDGLVARFEAATATLAAQNGR